MKNSTRKSLKLFRYFVPGVHVPKQVNCWIVEVRFGFLFPQCPDKVSWNIRSRLSFSLYGKEIHYSIESSARQFIRRNTILLTKLERIRRNLLCTLFTFLEKSGQFVITLLVFCHRNAENSRREFLHFFSFFLDTVQLFFVGGELFLSSHPLFFTEDLSCFEFLSILCFHFLLCLHRDNGEWLESGRLLFRFHVISMRGCWSFN